MRDLTLLYYSACLVEERFANNIRRHLLSLFPASIPIISVTHKPMDFGKNIPVEGFEVSIYNIYKQILLGAEAAETPYVACCEDDAMYNLGHFSYRPPLDTFAYNMNRWVVNPSIFFHRNRANMSMCMAPRDHLVATLRRRFEKFPTLLQRDQLVGFGEPGRSEFKLGLPPVKMALFNSEQPTLVFNHRPSVGGVRKLLTNDEIKENLPPWGKASKLWKNMWDVGNWDFVN